MSQRRRNKIEEVLSYLENQITQGNSDNDGIAENITFFRHAYSRIDFYKWLYTKATTIRQENLLELMDIDPNSPYDKELVTSLAATERKVFPGLVNPLVKEIFHLIYDHDQSIIMSLGSGAMEVERRVITKLIRSGNKKPVFFVGIDNSDTSHGIAKNNLAEIKSGINIIEINELNDTSLQLIINKNKSLYTIILCKNNIFLFDKCFKKSQFDVAYNCFFKHHLTAEQSEKADDILKRHTKIMIDYDGVKSNFNSFIQSLFVWQNPVLLNGTVFSNLRYLKKSDLKSMNDGVKIKTYWMKGTYLKETSNPKPHDPGII